MSALYSADFIIPEGSVLPEPSGYRLLVMMAKLEERTSGGIIRPSTTTGREETASIVAKVLQCGPDAYADDGKFPTGPWCKVGDLVIIRSYSGTRIEVKEREYRLINDDTVEGIVHDITALTRK